MSQQLTEGLLEGVDYGRGFFETVAGVQPAAHAPYHLPADFRYITLPVFLTFRLVCDANAANRFVTVDYADGNGNVYASSGTAAATIASATQDFAAEHDRTVGEHTAGSKVFMPLAHDYVRPGYTITINVANMQAGDQLSRIVWGLDRLPTGPRGYTLGAISHAGGRRAPVLAHPGR